MTNRSNDRHRTRCILACALLRRVLARDGWSVVHLHPSCVDAAAPDLPVSQDPLFRRSALIAGRDGRRIVFGFDTQSHALMQRMAREIRRRDRGQYRLLFALVVRSVREMDRLRRVDQAGRWPRVFFVAFEDLCREAVESASVSPGPGGSGGSPRETPFQTGHFPARVLGNVPVGARHGPHFKLRFQAAEMQSIVPGQFLMMSTHPRQADRQNRAIGWNRKLPSAHLRTTAYLKRPFGIHRAFYPNFEPGYLKRLALPPALSTILHTVHPNQFDLFYRALETGVGTREMMRLERGDCVDMLAPLGNRFDIRGLRRRGVEEVHIIGGGVGMAPLIFLIQSLLFHGFAVRVFLGVEHLASLRYLDELSPNYAAEPCQAHVYVDDLLEMGLRREDIFLATERDCLRDVLCGVPRKNLFRGFVSGLYQRWLDAHPSAPRMGRRGRVMAFACGPTPMMKAVYAITRRSRIPLQVLMEKRMACGIGVCFSCVCRTRRPGGTESYSRVCMDGPIFNADEIVWQ